MKKVITLILIIVMTAMLFLGCAEESAGETQIVVETQPVSAFNSTLVNAIGEEWLTSNKDTIDKLVGDLESANSTYRNGGELKDYFLTVRDIIDNNEEFRSNLCTGLEHAMQSNNDYVTLYSASFMWSPINSGIIYDAREIFGEPLSAEDVTEIENELINISNKISQLFYCKDIAS